MASGKGKKATSACQAGQAALAARLLGLISGETARDGKNLVFSPLSIHVALALMSTAAAGDTLREILRVAGAPSRGALAAFVRDTVVEGVLADQSAVGGPSISYACGTWTDKQWQLRPEYIDAIAMAFKACTWTVDFENKPVESKREINAWVAKATRNLITEVFKPDDDNAETVHVIANAIYFKGEWRNPFKKENTVDREFHLLDGSSVSVPFLQSWSYQCIACHSGFKVLKLPYEMTNEHNWSNWKLYDSLPKFSMLVFLPDGRKDLQSLVEKIASSPEFLHCHLPTEFVPVGEFRLPKFKLSFERTLVHDLKHLGLRLAFDRYEADMSEMLPINSKRGVCVNRVIHKAVIEMNEEGSEAAAVTMESDEELGCSMFDDSPPPVNFVADHPFTFFIVEERSGAVVFAGHVLDPSKEE